MPVFQLLRQLEKLPAVTSEICCFSNLDSDGNSPTLVLSAIWSQRP